MELTSLFGVRTDLQNDEFVGKLNVVVPLTRSELWESTWLKLNLATDGDCLVMGRESNAKSVKDKQPEDIGCWSKWYRGVRSSFGQSWKMASEVKTGLFIVVQRREITAERSLEGALMLVEPVIERLMCWLNLEWVGTTTHVQSLDSGAHIQDGCFVAKWCEKSISYRKSAVVVQERTSLSGSTENLKLSAWNCHRSSSSLPHIHSDRRRL